MKRTLAATLAAVVLAGSSWGFREMGDRIPIAHLTKTRRRSRAPMVVGLVVAVVVVAVMGLVVVAGGRASSPAEHARLACERFVAFKSSSANGQLTGASIDAELDRIAAMASSATPAVREAAVTLAAAGRPGDAAFLVASTALSDACAPSNG
jgi:hypothetical protein